MLTCIIEAENPHKGSDVTMSLQLGVRLADLRKRNGFSQEALAEKMGVSRQAISKWERGESTPDTDTLIELSRLYSVSLDSLVGNQEEKSEEKKAPSQNAEGSEEKKAAIYPGISSKLLRFPVPLVIAAVYVFAGLAFKLWHPFWLIFLLIPAYYHLAIGMKAKTKKGLLLGLPVFEAALILFLILGFAFSAWKYAWILFIAAICYYWTVGFYIKKK